VHEAVGKAVSAFLNQADAALPSGYSAVLYGSAARGDFFPGWSDINLLLVTNELTPTVLRSLRRAMEDWRKSTIEPPLLISRAEWDRATDVFPLEITDMHHAHQVLRGPDPVVGLQVDPADLRAALERELRGKLLRLRQGYAARSSDESALGALATRSASSVLALLRGLLTLRGRPIPSDAVQTASAASAMIGIDDEALLGVVRHRGEPGWRCTGAAFEAYVEAVARAASYVDQLNPGDQR
jgi:predicted nucleotidyltransferase